MARGPRMGALAVLAAAAPLLLAEGLRLGEGPPFEQDFAACVSKTPCGSEGLRSHYLLDLLAGARDAALRVASGGRRPVLLHIGASTFGNTAEFSDVDLWSKALSLLPGGVRNGSSLVLVEPNSIFFPDLRQNARRLTSAPGQVTVMPGMVSDVCKANSTGMYRFSRQVEQDFGIPFNVYGSWFSVSKEFPPRALGGFIKQPTHWPFSDDDMRNFRRFSAMPNVSSYVQKVKVPCFTPSSLLASAGVRAEDLAMVVIDAEGNDHRIVRELAKLPGFKPGYLQWEGSMTSKIVQRTASDIQKHGFKVGGVGARNDDDEAENVVAVPGDPGELRAAQGA